MSVRYRPDYGGMAALGRSAQMGRAMLAAAEVGRQAAASHAAQFSRSGGYGRSLEVREQETIGGRRNERRAGAAVVANVPYAARVERKHKVLGETAKRAIEGAR